jgi:membrane-associated protease RseP (regulator of RpoE activity)
VAAGPAFNLLFAVLAYAALFVHGVPGVKAAPRNASDSPCARYRGTDLIRAVDGKPMAT